MFHESGNEFKPTGVTKRLPSGLFHAYLSFVVEVSRLSQRLANWFEGCHCHADVLLAPRQPANRRRCTEKRDQPSAPFLAHALQCPFEEAPLAGDVRRQHLVNVQW